MAKFTPTDPAEFVDELERQAISHILRLMPPDPSGELAASTFTDLLLIYGNWRARFVRANPREVHVSKKLQTSLKAAEHKEALDAIIDSLESGRDVTHHLSRGIKTAYVAHSQRNSRLHRRSDLDLLISDWGIHHLHLSTDIEADGFVKRTGDLLFAAFTDRDAYLIGIYPHGSWARHELVETLVREWPNTPLIASSLTGLKLVNPVDEDEHRQLRNAGVTTLMEVDGAIVMPGPGMTTAGTPSRVTLRTNKIIQMLTDLRSNLDTQLSALNVEFPPVGSDRSVWEPKGDGDALHLRRGELAVRLADLW